MLGLLIKTPNKKISDFQSHMAARACCSRQTDYLKEAKISNILYVWLRPIWSLVLLAIYSFLSATQICHAQSITASNVSVIRILSPDSGSCGSAILSDQTIITNAHLASSFCTYRQCSALNIISADNRESTYNKDQVSLQKISSVFDLAVLKLSSAPKGFPTAESRLQNSQAELRALSFPGCKDLTYSEGRVLEHDAKLYLNSSLAVRHGSSGGAVFDTSGLLFGIISESDSLSGAAKSLLTGQNFSYTRIIPAELLSQLIRLSDSELFEYQTDLLTDFYFNQVLPAEKINRIAESARFLSKVKLLALENFKNPASATLLAGLTTTPYPFFADGIQDFANKSSLLALIASIEKSGLNKSLSSKLKSEEINQIMINFADSANVLQQIFQKFSVDRYDGADLELLYICLKAAACLIVAIFAALLAGLIIISKKNVGLITKIIMTLVSLGIILIALVLSIRQILFS